MDRITPGWELAVCEVVAAIPAGQVLAYGQVARRAGRPGRARLVARILASGAAHELPWHRVVRADGRIGLDPDSADGREQVRRLRAEGVQVDNARVRMPRAPADLDALLWAPPPD